MAATGRFFEDFRLGERLLHATPRTLTSGDAALYLSLYGSRHPLHCAETYALAQGFERMPLDQMLVFHVAFGKTVNDISLNAVANLGYAELRFHLPVFAGDTLSVESDVIGLKLTSSGKTGIVYVHSRADNQHGHCVLEWKRWVLVNCRTAPDHAIADLPALAPMLPAGNLKLPAGLRPVDNLVRISGDARRAGDYGYGDVLDHGGGMLIGQSDHMLATRLYQNNARVHFDAAHMARQASGKPLVYGGHIMSMVRALSYNGLENAFWLLGFNSGTHAHPAFAGDTIYAASVTLEQQRLAADFSAVRVVSFGLKTEPDACLLGELPALASSNTLPQAIALKWDYWAVLPG